MVALERPEQRASGWATVMKNVLRMKAPTSSAISANDEQERVDERQAVVDGVLRLLGDGGASDRLDAVGQAGLPRRDLGDTVLGDDGDLPNIRGSPTSLRRFEREQHDARSSGRVGRPERDDAGHRDLGRATSHEHGGAVARFEARVRSALAVDHRLAVQVGARPAAIV